MSQPVIRHDLPLGLCFREAVDAQWRNLISLSRFRAPAALLLPVMLLWVGMRAGFGQVSPSEIVNPQLKALEQTYFPQLEALNRAIRSTKFPFTFLLSRYVGLDPQHQTEADTRGLEFVKFHERLVLKITGNYNAAYNADLLTENERASRTFNEVIAPILQLVPEEIPAQVACDAVGFEISYHVRRRNRSYDYEGKEILVVVLGKADALSYSKLSNDSDRQDVLNRSEIFLSGKAFGLALGGREPLDVEGLERSALRKPEQASASAPTPTSNTDRRLSSVKEDPRAGFEKPDTKASMGTAGPASPGSSPQPGSDKPEVQAAPGAAPSPGDADRLQVKYKAQIDELVREGLAKFHFVDYAPPSFAIFRNHVVLQLTLRNPERFERESTSIYKRAAQSFDLFLAPLLKSILEKVPQGEEFDTLDITVLNGLASTSKASSEATDFICPIRPLRQFAEAEITSQDLVNQSIVLVNGVRIALNLQQVE